VRHIHKRGAADSVPDLLETIFAAELVLPSRCLWIVSPWISNVAILDNGAHAYLSIEPAWAQGPVRLVQVLHKLMELGTQVVVATRAVTHNDTFLRALGGGAGAPGRLVVRTSEELHTKGILGDGFYLSGSMNITHHGITLNEEAVEYTTEAAVVAGTRLEFRERWGGGA
jgi:hypothetical protein